MRHWKFVHDEGLGGATLVPPHVPIIDGADVAGGTGAGAAPDDGADELTALGARTFSPR